MRGFRIKTVARLTGIGPAVLRTWERRYQVVNPRRTAGGYREYSDADVDRLRRLKELTERGHAISEIAQLPVEELAALSRPAPPKPEAAGPLSEGPAPVPPPASRLVGAAAAAARAGSTDRMWAALQPAFLLGAPAAIAGEVLLPLLSDLEEDGGPGGGGVPASVARERIRGVISLLSPPATGPAARVMVLPGPGDVDGAAALRAALVAVARGWAVEPMGAAPDPSEVAGAARRLRARALVAAFSIAPDPARFLAFLDAVARGAGEIPLALFGASLAPFRPAIEARGAVWVRGEAALGAWLATRGGEDGGEDGDEDPA